MVASRSKRPRRHESTSAPSQFPSLPPTACDSDKRVVYVDLKSFVENYAHVALVAWLQTVQEHELKDHRKLSQLSPINANRLLYEVKQLRGEVLGAWLVQAMKDPNFKELLKPLIEPTNKLRLIGAHFIIPKVTEYSRGILQPQKPHQDIASKGEVVAIAIDLSGKPLNTLINAGLTSTRTM